MKPILKYPGAKWKITPFLLEHIPPHSFYLEPFFGSGAVFFQKMPCKHETVNDANGDVVNFFRVCRDFPEDLCEALRLTPYARDEFTPAQETHAGAPLRRSVLHGLWRKAKRPRGFQSEPNQRRPGVRKAMGSHA